MSKITAGERPPLLPSMPDALRALLRDMWATEVARRPSVVAVAAELEAISGAWRTLPPAQRGAADEGALPTTRGDELDPTLPHAADQSDDDTSEVRVSSEPALSTTPTPRKERRGSRGVRFSGDVA